jgi:hypothetical protein
LRFVVGADARGEQARQELLDYLSRHHSCGPAPRAHEPRGAPFTDSRHGSNGEKY